MFFKRTVIVASKACAVSILFCEISRLCQSVTRCHRFIKHLVLFSLPSLVAVYLHLSFCLLDSEVLIGRVCLRHLSILDLSLSRRWQNFRHRCSLNRASKLHARDPSVCRDLFAVPGSPLFSLFRAWYRIT